MTDPKIPAPEPCAQISGGLLQWYFPPADAYYPVDAKYLRGLHMLITLESAETYAAAREAAAVAAERERCQVELREWAVQRWRAEVENRPLVNHNRRPLDDCWRQVMRHAGLDPEEAVGPSHDALWFEDCMRRKAG